MSFILDALRKSEHERQRGTTPGLTHVPLATPAPEMPRWAIYLIALLGATVLVLAIAWWQTRGAPASMPATAAPFVERPLDLPGAVPAATSTRSVPAAAAPPADPTPAAPAAREASPGPTRPLAEAALGAGTRPLAAAVQSEPAAPARTPTPSAEPVLPSAAALVAQGISLPRLRLELHGYAPERANRFVFVNGRKYVEGERLADGPELVAIDPQGVVLEYNGRRFLLLPE